VNPSTQSVALLIGSAPEVPKASIPDIGGEINGRVFGDRVLFAARLLWRRRGFVTRVVLVGTMLFLLIAFLLPNSYEAQTVLMPPGSGASGIFLALGADDADLLGWKSSGTLLVSMLNSDTLQNRLINRFDLRRVYSANTYRGARQELGKHTYIHENRRSGAISITVTDDNPQRSLAMAQTYVEELNRTIADLGTSAAHRKRVFLEERIKVVEQELEWSAREFGDFSSKNTTIDLEEQGRATIRAASLLQGQITDVESELRGLEQIYTSNNVRVRNLQAKVTELRRKLMTMNAGVNVFSPSDDRGEFYPSIRQLPMLGVTYDNLFRRFKINESILEVLTNEYQLSRIEEAKQVPRIEVLDDAKSSEKRSGPPRLLITLSGSLLSFCFAAFWLFGRDACISNR